MVLRRSKGRFDLDFNLRMSLMSGGKAYRRYFGREIGKTIFEEESHALLWGHLISRLWGHLAWGMRSLKLKDLPLGLKLS